MKFDLHMHTRRHSPDAASDPFDLVKAAHAAGLDGIVITEHDYLWPEAELEELRAPRRGLVILAGVEVTGRGGDMLCYGVADPFALPAVSAGRNSAARSTGKEARPSLPIRTAGGSRSSGCLPNRNRNWTGSRCMSNNMDADLRHACRGATGEVPPLRTARQQRLTRTRHGRMLLYRFRSRDRNHRRPGCRNSREHGNRASQSSTRLQRLRSRNYRLAG